MHHHLTDDPQDPSDDLDPPDLDPADCLDGFPDPTDLLFTERDPTELATHLFAPEGCEASAPWDQVADGSLADHTEERSHLAHVHDHQQDISFGGYSHCTCGCGGFMGNGAQCTNCGHSFAAHFR
jgi:hypothetical protein